MRALEIRGAKINVIHFEILSNAVEPQRLLRDGFVSFTGASVSDATR